MVPPLPSRSPEIIELACAELLNAPVHDAVRDERRYSVLLSTPAKFTHLRLVLAVLVVLLTQNFVQ
jgi:hypothetical protein